MSHVIGGTYSEGPTTLNVGPAHKNSKYVGIDLCDMRHVWDVSNAIQLTLQLQELLLLRRKLVWLKRTEGINMALQSKNRQIIAVAIKAVIIKTSQIYLKIPKIAIAVVH